MHPLSERTADHPDVPGMPAARVGQVTQEGMAM